MPVPEALDAEWPAVPPNVPVARRAVTAYLAAAATPDPPLNDIAVAVSEAVSNVVVHAYRHTDPGLVRVRVELHDERIECMVDDEGSGMAPRADTPGLGLGMPLIATLTERFDVRKGPQGGTRLCMWFRRDPSAATLPG